MPKSTKKIQAIFFGILLIFIMMIWSVNGWGNGGGKLTGEGEREAQTALEETLGKIEGVGKVAIYYDDHQEAKEDPLSAYFSLSQKEARNDSDDIKGILVVAEGGGDPKIQNLLSKTVATVLRLHEHQIVIVEMKKEGEIQ